MNNIKQLFRTTLFTIALILLAGCSGAGKCPGTKGATCMMLSEVDRMIDSGEIDKFQERAKCKGLFCKKGMNKPLLTNDDVVKVKVIEPTEPVQYQEGDYLYVK